MKNCLRCFLSSETMLRREAWRPLWMPSILLLIGVAVSQLIDSSYGQHLIVLSCIFVMLTTSYNLVVGYTGYLTLAHATFFGLGGYCSALLMMRLDLPFIVAFAITPFLVGVVSIMVGALALRRVSGFAFIIVTLGFAITTQLIATNWISLTRGPFGIPGVPRPHIQLPGGVELVVRSNYEYLIFALVLLTVITLVVEAMTSSRVGRAMLAIRENQQLANAYGVNPFMYKLLAFVISSMLAAVTGAFNAHYLTFVSPDMMSFYWIVTPLVMLIVGGSGHKVGILIATVTLAIIPELLRMSQGLRQLLYGLVLLFFIILLPGGIGRIIENFHRRLRLNGQKKL